MSVSPFPHFFSHEVCSLVIYNAVWNNLIMDEPVCKYTKGSFSEVLTANLPAINVCSSKDKGLHSL